MFDRRTEGRWWDIGLDLVTGCTPVSPGCANCWSAEKAHRAGQQRNPKIKARYSGLTDSNGHWTGEVRPQWQDLAKIGSARKPQVYTFWNDLFHPGVSFDLSDGEEKFMDEVIIKILTRPQHFYIICTKRPERALEYFLSRHKDLLAWQVDPDWPDAMGILSRRLMLMTSTENQEMADLRVTILLQIPGVMHGVNVEPILGPVKFRKTWLTPDPEWSPGWQYGHLDFVVCGGETGPHARPMHPDIPRSLRDQCRAAGTPFFFKGWGEWVSPYAQTGSFVNLKGKCEHIYGGAIGVDVVRVGKKAAGRLLDGRTWDEVPEVKE